jgi:hypothetical protein
MSDHPFDTLARALAAGISRRRALQALGGAVLGTLAAAPPRAVLAQGNSQCAHFCATVFGADTPAADQCTSDAAHGRGLCYGCGPAAPTGHPDLCGAACCPTTASNCCDNTTCVNLQSDVSNCGTCGKQCVTSVANAHATCTGGTCGFACNTGYKLCNGACIASSACCTAADCPAGPANSTATCTNGTCGFACDQGYKACNRACIPTSVCCDYVDCLGIKEGSVCLNGSCQCPATTFDCGRQCTSLCSSRPSYFLDRFQFCLTNITADCRYCTGWMGCYGTIDTQSICGTVTAGC